MKKIILASQSPRRKELLNQIGLKYEIVPSNIEEEVDSTLSFEENIEKIALEKAKDVASKIEQDALIIAADTMVVYNELLAKPKDKSDAIDMLTKLSGNIHQVITAVAIFDTTNNNILVRNKKTDVRMKNISQDEIIRYIESGEVWDKAGSYAIQGLGSLLVEEIDGCYFNVMGLPLSLLGEMLNTFEINLL